MKKQHLKVAGLYIIIILTLCFMLFPVYWMFVMSIKPQAEHFVMPPRIIFEPTFENYQQVIFGGAYSWQAPFGNATQRAAGVVTVQTAPQVLKNTFIIASLTTLIALLISIPAAYSFSRYRMKGSRDLQFYILAQRMAPPIAIIVPLFTLLRWAGFHNTYWGIILTHLSLNLPLAVWLMKGFIDDVPREIDESAELDGCSTIGIIWKIVAPIAKPSIAAVGILCFLFSWNEFLFASTLAGPDTQTLTVFISQFVTNIYIDWGALATVVIISFIPTVILVLILQRYFIRGLTFGAVKG